MRSACTLALLALVAGPTATRADDVAALYPDSAVFVFGLDVKGITTSPLGKKVIGTDKPFDATRKLLKVLFPEEVMPVTDAALKPLEAAANKLERVTVVGEIGGGGGPPPIAVYLEGEIDEADYIKAAKGIATAERKEFRTENVGDRKLLIVGEGRSAVYGLAVSKSLFLIATTRELIDEVLDKHAGKKKAKVQKALADWIKKVKPAETPIWLAVGEMEFLSGITGGVATIALAADADFRIEIGCDKEDTAKDLTRAVELVVDYLARAKTPQAKVWAAAGIVAKQDGKIVTATGSIPGKLLIDEYAKQK
jgi:hypothetical protein